MIAEPSLSLSESREAHSRNHRFPLVLAASIVIAGCVVMLCGYWFRKTSETAACYKAYHRARADLQRGRGSLELLCAASRRCCLAQYDVPRLEKASVLEAHLKRINTLQPPSAGSDGTDDPNHSRILDIWRVYQAEAELWVNLGKPK